MYLRVKVLYTEADIKGRQVEAEGGEIFCLYARIGFSHKRSHVAHRKWDRKLPKGRELIVTK